MYILIRHRRVRYAVKFTFSTTNRVVPLTDSRDDELKYGAYLEMMPKNKF